MDLIKSKKRILKGAAFVLYLSVVLWYTVLKRPVGLYFSQFELFWSYRRWFAGSAYMGREILANVAMFVPFGFMLSGLIAREESAAGPAARWRQAMLCILCAATFSLLIESLQLFWNRGLFEWDDLFNNSIGAVLGILLHRALKLFRHGSLLEHGLIALFVLVCLGLFVQKYAVVTEDSDTVSRLQCVQVDLAEETGPGELRLRGFALRYDHAATGYTLSLRSTGNGKRIPMKTEITDRPEVNEYFLCAYDYTRTGFAATAAGLTPGEEYELMIHWPWSISMSTGIFLTDTEIHYIPKSKAIPPEGGQALQEITDQGTLLVCRPDRRCWVYQVGRSLYWIAGEGFSFEDDETTYIQYQLWTTQPERLPEKRREQNYNWDNIGGYFEKHELEGDFGPYRVMKRDLPSSYAVTSVLTGYYKNKRWVWGEYFRPVYDFS